MKTRDELHSNSSKAGGNQWEKVASHIDFNATSTKKEPASKTTSPLSATPASATTSSAVKNNKDEKSDVVVKKDTSRMKSVLLQLKNDSKAPGASVDSIAAR